MKKLFFLFLTSIVLFVGCNKTDELAAIKNEAERLMDNYPDSILVMLDSMALNGKVNKMNPDYILLSVQAKDKARMDISKDTLIFSIPVYYEKQDKNKEAALSNMYCGRVYSQRNEYDKALESYIRAKTFANNIGDSNLKGSISMFIGEVFYKIVSYDLAIEAFKEALVYFTESEELYHKAVHPYREIAKTFDLMKQPDSALYYYDKGLSIAIQEKDTTTIRVYKQNIASTYTKMGEYDRAIALLKEVLTLHPNNRNLAYAYRSMAEVYFEENKLDSVTHYLNLALEYIEPDNDNLLGSIYSLYYKLETKQKDYQAALKYHELYTKHMNALVKKRWEQVFSIVEKNYEYESMQNQLKQKTIQQQRILLFCSVLLVILLVISFLLYQNRVKNKNLSKEIYEKMKELDNLSKNIEKNNNEYQKAFAEQFKILEKAATLDYHLNEEERLKGKKLIQKFNEIVYDQKEGVNWEKLYTTINGMSGGHLDTMKEKLPQLNEMEFKICGLTYAGLNNTQIGIILRIALDTVQAKKTGIRKKLGMEKNQNLRSFLEGITK